MGVSWLLVFDNFEQLAKGKRGTVIERLQFGLRYKLWAQVRQQRAAAEQAKLTRDGQKIVRRFRELFVWGIDPNFLATGRIRFKIRRPWGSRLGISRRPAGLVVTICYWGSLAREHVRSNALAEFRKILRESADVYPIRLHFAWRRWE